MRHEKKQNKQELNKIVGKSKDRLTSQDTQDDHNLFGKTGSRQRKQRK